MNTGITDKKAEALSRTDGEHKKHRSFGNKVFDFTVWPALQWIGVWGASLAIAYKVNYGKNGFKKTVASLTEKLELFFKKPAGSQFAQKMWGSSAKEWARDTILFFSLAIGGTLLVPVTKWFERHRERISARIDRAFGKEAKDPRKVEPEPRQTWWSMMAGRLASVAVAFSAFIALGPTRSDHVSKSLGGWATQKWVKAFGGNPSTVRKWADMAVFDLIFTSATAVVMYVWSRSVAKKHDTGKPAANPESQRLQEERAPSPEDGKTTAHRDRAGRDIPATPQRMTSYTQAVSSSRSGSDQPALI